MANYMNRKSKKELNPEVVQEVSDAAAVKEQPIYLPDGVPVKVGMTVYSVMNHEVTSYPYGKDSVLSHSGNLSSSVRESKVIAVNQAAISRTFTIRSDRGCEETYTVRNNCLPNIYGKKVTAVREVSDKQDSDVAKCEEKIKKYSSMVDKWKATASKIKKQKIP